MLSERVFENVAGLRFQIITGFLTVSLRLDVEELLYLADVGLIDKTCVSKVALLLGLLLCEDVPLIGVLSLDFASAGEGEPLLGAGICFHFRHFALSFGPAELP